LSRLQQSLARAEAAHAWRTDWSCIRL